MHGLEYAALRYSNVYGPRQDPHGEAGVVAIFSTLLSNGERLSVHGDGGQTRDYVYVGDAVAANMHVSDASLPAARTLDDRAFNVGGRMETSVLELAAGLARASRRPAAVDHLPARPGELRHSSLDASPLRRLGWKVGTALEDGLGGTYRWIAGA